MSENEFQLHEGVRVDRDGVSLFLQPSNKVIITFPGEAEDDWKGLAERRAFFNKSRAEVAIIARAATDLGEKLTVSDVFYPGAVCMAEGGVKVFEDLLIKSMVAIEKLEELGVDIPEPGTGPLPPVLSRTWPAEIGELKEPYKICKQPTARCEEMIEAVAKVTNGLRLDSADVFSLEQLVELGTALPDVRVERPTEAKPEQSAFATAPSYRPLTGSLQPIAETPYIEKGQPVNVGGIDFDKTGVLLPAAKKTLWGWAVAAGKHSGSSVEVTLLVPEGTTSRTVRRRVASVRRILRAAGLRRRDLQVSSRVESDPSKQGEVEVYIRPRLP